MCASLDNLSYFSVLFKISILSWQRLVSASYLLASEGQYQVSTVFTVFAASFSKQKRKITIHLSVGVETDVKNSI